MLEYKCHLIDLLLWLLQMKGGNGCEFPLVPGHGFAGVIEQVGVDSITLHPRDEV